MVLLRWYESLLLEPTNIQIRTNSRTQSICVSYFLFLVLVFVFLSFLPESSLAWTAYNEHEFRCYIKKPWHCRIYRTLYRSVAIKLIICFRGRLTKSVPSGWDQWTSLVKSSSTCTSWPCDSQSALVRLPYIFRFNIVSRCINCIQFEVQLLPTTMPNCGTSRCFVRELTRCHWYFCLATKCLRCCSFVA